MSNTPKTDAAVKKSLANDGGKFMTEDLLMLARELERESIDRKNEIFDSGWNAALAALKEICADKLRSFDGYSWDSGAGSSGYDKALDELAEWADVVRLPSALSNTGYEPRDCGEKLKP